jgi:hypothetical protein
VGIPLWIGNEIEGFRAAKLGGRRPPVSLLVVEDYLPVLPLNGFEAIGHEDWETFAVRLLGFAEQEIGLVYSIDNAILWHRHAGDFREGRKGIDLVNDLVTHTAGRNSAGPADNERRSQRTFHVREIVAPPRGLMILATATLLPDRCRS